MIAYTIHYFHQLHMIGVERVFVLLGQFTQLFEPRKPNSLIPQHLG